MTEEKMIEILPAEPGPLNRAIARFERVMPSTTRKDWLTVAVANGWLSVTQVNVARLPHFVVWFSALPDGRLYVDTAQSVSTRADFAALLQAVDMLAKEHKCATIEFRTRRRGLVKQCQQAGFEVHSVFMTKNLSHAS